MPTINITNTVASQALRGQNIKITVNLSSHSAEFAQLEVGQLCQNNAGKQGVIYSVDTFGNSFEISPYQPDFNMSDIEGYQDSGQDISITV